MLTNVPAPLIHAQPILAAKTRSEVMIVFVTMVTAKIRNQTRVRVSLIKKSNDVDSGLSLFIKCKMCVIISGGGVLVVLMNFESP